ncbi:unnamed protein product [Pedinophyceae sp. YPF-701]|nr:unnamed protein product [Pedinophyceae sp. YPF-701]
MRGALERLARMAGTALLDDAPRSMMALRASGPLATACTRGLHCTPPAGNGPTGDCGAYNFVALNTLVSPKTTKEKRRLGRGSSSAHGESSGRGNKGQKHRGRMGLVPFFEGGATRTVERLPRSSKYNTDAPELVACRLSRLVQWVQKSYVDPAKPITMKVLRDERVVSKHVKEGVILVMDDPAEVGDLSGVPPLHIEVTRATDAAARAVRAAGGSVTTVYYNKLGLFAMLKPHNLERKGRKLPQPARPPPKLITKFDKIGSIPAPETLDELPQLRAGDGWKLRLPPSAEVTQRFHNYLERKKAQEAVSGA